MGIDQRGAAFFRSTETYYILGLIRLHNLLFQRCALQAAGAETATTNRTLELISEQALSDPDQKMVPAEFLLKLWLVNRF